MKNILLLLLVIVTSAFTILVDVNRNVIVIGTGPGYVRVQRSLDMTNWMDFGASLNVFNSTNDLVFSDPFGGGRVFYRAIYYYANPVFP